MNSRKVNRIRLGALVLVCSGLLGVTGEFLRGRLIDPEINPTAFALMAISPTFGLGWILMLFSATLALFGVLAIYTYLADGPVDGLAFWGMVASMLGNSLYLVFTGYFAFAAPAIGKTFLEDMGSYRTVNNLMFVSFVNPDAPASSLLYPVSLIGALGSILLGITIWRSGSLAKWAGILFAIHTPLMALATSFLYPLDAIGALAVLVSEIWLAIGMWRPPSKI